ncbi:MAG: DEAD/DEAH box helicase [Clostridiales bacterium]|jgi:ATP-dependent Lhr-like helicase|nr:DEAD/DEAH box helicase [Clostridiales bacterium]
MTADRTGGQSAFERLAPFIQDFIYQNNWTEIRGIQIAACGVIFDTDSNLLLSSGTASGKTEAAFLPVLTELYNHPSRSVGVMYISPLKALINDQFKRLDQLLLESGIPVCKWHGDAPVKQKNDLIKNPRGLLQITPESLESLLINKRGACVNLFSDLRFVIIDEVHYFMRDLRGVQVLCLLERIQRLTGNNPRRIGLSATLGDLRSAKDWLNTGSHRDCIAPVTDEGKKSIRLHMHRFVRELEQPTAIALPEKAVNHAANPDGSDVPVSALESYTDSGDRAHFEYLFKMTLDKKTIIFANSREESEFIITNLREVALKHKAPDVYRVHHGNVSALLREQTEDEMKASEEKIVTSATVTLELGIDIGSLDQAVQVGAPATVSSFAQRIGRCGRRGQIPQLLFTFIESIDTAATDALGPINWEFLRAIAIIELYTKEKWLEPMYAHRHPYALLYHQTMSFLKSGGEHTAAELAQFILTLAPFKHISQEDYKTLLTHLIEIEHLQKTENGGLIIGRAGERIVNHFHFYTVFIVPEYYLVKEENRAIGTVDKIFPPGIRFSLAGITWETVDVNTRAKVIFVKRVPGISVVDWDVDFDAELHTVLVRKMREILLTDNVYPYMSESCSERLRELQYLTRNSGILEKTVTQLSEKKFAIFPWIGTRPLFTLHYALLQKKVKSRMPWRTCVYLEVYFDGEPWELEEIIREIVSAGIDVNALPLPADARVRSKYNEYIPPALLRKQYAEDFLDYEGLREDVRGNMFSDSFSFSPRIY